MTKIEIFVCKIELLHLEEFVFVTDYLLTSLHKEVLVIRRIFSLVDTITNTKFSNCPNVFKIGVVWQ